jgi:hypothetical protein
MTMTHVTYKIVRHDSGWAYTANGTFSEPFPSRDAALKAAKRALHRNSARPAKPMSSNTKTRTVRGEPKPRPAATGPTQM